MLLGTLLSLFVSRLIMRGRSKLFVFVFAVFFIASLVMMPAVRVNAESSAPITFSSGLTLYSPVNTTYSSSVVECNGNFTGSEEYEIQLNYTIDGNYQGSVPWKLYSSNASTYTVVWSFQLPKLPHGSHELSIGIDQQLYNSSGALINQTTQVNSVYFTLNSTLITVNELILIISLTAIVVVLVIVLLIYRMHRKTGNLKH